MPRPNPRLSVRLKTTRTDQDITDQLASAPSFRIVIPGGYASATITLNRPLNLTRDDIELYARLFIYDARSANTVWEGRLEDPGRSSDSGGSWEITALGPSAHANDINAPYILVDRSFERWHRSRYSSGAHVELSEIDDPGSSGDMPTMRVYAEEGTPVSLAWNGDWIYRSIWYAGQRVARVRADFVCGGSSAAYRVGVYTRVGDGAANFQSNNNWSTTPGIIGGSYVDGVPTNTNVASLRADRITSTTTANSQAYADFYGVVIRAQLKNADGSDITDPNSYLVNNVDPVEAVADLLGRFLPLYDGANAILIGSGVDINQLAYPDGVTPAQVLDDLMVFDPGYYWAAWESNVAGRYRFEYKPWPTTIRYEATTTDGFNSPGSAADLYNSVHVRWRHPNGRIMNTIRSQTVAGLASLRQAYIDLTDETGDPVNAVYVGDNFLAEHRYPPNAGTLTVARPILDNATGRMVMPWEILPGYLIRVQGVNPRVDSLNPVARDGVTVFKIVSMEYNGSDVASTLELDSQSRTVANALRNLYKRRLKRR